MWRFFTPLAKSCRKKFLTPYNLWVPKTAETKKNRDCKHQPFSLRVQKERGVEGIPGYETARCGNANKRKRGLQTLSQTSQLNCFAQLRSSILCKRGYRSTKRRPKNKLIPNWCHHWGRKIALKVIKANLLQKIKLWIRVSITSRAQHNSAPRSRHWIASLVETTKTHFRRQIRISTSCRKIGFNVEIQI